MAAHAGAVAPAGVVCGLSFSSLKGVVPGQRRFWEGSEEKSTVGRPWSRRVLESVDFRTPPRAGRSPEGKDRGPERRGGGPERRRRGPEREGRGPEREGRGPERKGTRAGVKGTRAGAKGTRAGARGRRAGAKGTRAEAKGTRAGAKGTRAGAKGTRAGAKGTRAGAKGPCAGPKGMPAGSDASWKSAAESLWISDAETPALLRHALEACPPRARASTRARSAEAGPREARRIPWANRRRVESGTGA